MKSITIMLWVLVGAFGVSTPAMAAEDAVAAPAAPAPVTVPPREQAPLPASAIAPVPPARPAAPIVVASAASSASTSDAAPSRASASAAPAPTAPAPPAPTPAPVSPTPVATAPLAPTTPAVPAPVSTTMAPPPAPAKPAAPRLVIDDFEGTEIQNRIGGRTNVFQKAPSKAMISRRDDTIEGRRTRVLLLRYDKQAEGGPYGMGGWCGYYTLLKKPGHLVAPAAGASPQPEQSEDEYLDGSAYKAITFWVRGAQGGESFMVGLADRHWDKMGDSVKSEVIGKYLPVGKVTTTWQKAVVPLDAFFVDYAKLGSIAISFETDAFPEGRGAGTIYVDDLALE